MEWLIQFLLKYWLEQMFTLITSTCIAFVKRTSVSNKALKKGLVAMLRDRLYQSYNYHTKNGYFPIDAREVADDMYEQYHALGGNGVVAHLKETLDKQPTSL